MGYGAFDEVLAGDLTGEDPDIESVVAAQIGDVEVYKVNHHGSRFSSNDAWLNASPQKPPSSPSAATALAIRPPTRWNGCTTTTSRPIGRTKAPPPTLIRCGIPSAARS